MQGPVSIFWLAAAVFLAGGGARSLGQSVRSGWGAVPYSGPSGTGVTFRVWAPAATSVHVAGSFNGWSMTANPLALESPTSGVWSADVAAARVGHNYKYVINGSLWRSDPRSRIINAADHNNSVITPTNAFDWGVLPPGVTATPDLVIYEAHVGTFPGAGGTFATFTNRLDDLLALGVTAIELMPINEFPSPTSWGYNPAYPFAVESNYGSPDDLRRLVREARRRRMDMILDVVHNHWDGGSSLWELDGTSPGPYFFDADPYRWTWWGPRPDYRRPEVRAFIEDTFRMWREEYRISGFRWDAPWHILNTTNGVFIPSGLQMITNVLRMLAAEYPGAWNIAEDVKEIAGFDFHWDLSFAATLHQVLTQPNDENRDLAALAHQIAGTPARVIFSESHDTTGDLNNGRRLPTAIHPGEPEGYYARKRSQLGMGLVMTAPGTPMVWQGQELLETNQFSDTRPMDWSRTNRHAGNWRLYRDLIRLRRNLDGTSAGLQGDSVSVYQVDNTQKYLAYSRWDSAATAAAVVVVANLANTARRSLPVRFPLPGTWYLLFNSDSTDYAADYENVGLSEVAASGEPPVGLVDVGRYSVLIYSRSPRGGLILRDTPLRDEPWGNRNGAPDPGETIFESLVLSNRFPAAAEGVRATLAALSGGVTILQNTADFGTIPAAAAATGAVEFVYRLDPDLACGAPLRFALAATYSDGVWTNVFERRVGHLRHLPAATNNYPVWTPTPIPDLATVFSDLTISEPEDPVVVAVRVWLRINHTYDRDLVLALQHPDGAEVLLVNRRGRSGDNFGTGTCGAATYTVLDQSAAVSITNGTAPFAGTFRPEGALETFREKSLNGTWRLRMSDVDSGDAGTNLCWGLEIVSERRVCETSVFSNRPPRAVGTNLVVCGPVDFFLAGEDEDGQPLTFQVPRPPSHGRLTLRSALTGQSTYLPVWGHVGTDAAEFAVSDGLATSPPAVIIFLIPPPEDLNGNHLPDEWELRHWGNLSEANSEADDDGDSIPNWAEAAANTHPLRAESKLRFLPFDPAKPERLRWQSVGGVRYRIEWTDDPAAGTYHAVERPLEEEMDPADWGTDSQMVFTDEFLSGRASGGPDRRFYRIRLLRQ